jgi:hypothetical protein
LDYDAHFISEIPFINDGVVFGEIAGPAFQAAKQVGQFLCSYLFEEMRMM